MKVISYLFSVLFLASPALVATGCNEEKAPVTAPDQVIDPNFEFHDLAEQTQADGAVTLTLRASLASRDGTPCCIELHAEARNAGAETLHFDQADGCGCETPALALQSPDGDYCRRSYPLCPCSIEQSELDPNDEVGSVDWFPLCSGPSGGYEAMASFTYRIHDNGEWVVHTLEVRLPLTLPDPGEDATP